MDRVGGAGVLEVCSASKGGVELTKFAQDVSPESHVRTLDVFARFPAVRVQTCGDLPIVGDCGYRLPVLKFGVGTNHGPTDSANILAMLELREECLDPFLDWSGALVTERDHIGVYVRERDISGSRQSVFSSSGG